MKKTIKVHINRGVLEKMLAHKKTDGLLYVSPDDFTQQWLPCTITYSIPKKKRA
jgi:hypothetical protein